MLTAEQEVDLNEAARILGISSQLVVHRMEIGDLPFRYVGKHRCSQLKDVLAPKSADRRTAQCDGGARC